MLTKNFAFIAALAFAAVANGAPPEKNLTQSRESQVTFHTKEIAGVNVFYREAGPKNAPTIVLLHGKYIRNFLGRNVGATTNHLSSK